MATATPFHPVPTSSPPIHSTSTATLTSSPSLSQNEVTTINATPIEVSTGKLTCRNLEAGVRALHQDGLVVIANAIPNHSVLDRLNAKMTEDAKVLRDMKDKSPFNYNKGNLQQDAPPIAEWFSPEIFLSKVPFLLFSATHMQSYLATFVRAREEA
jgi:hypothetical protein